MNLIPSRNIRAIDLFCGAGGSSHGAQNAGIEIVAGFDIWEPAIQTYKSNFPNAEIFPGDIRTLTSKNIKRIKTSTGKIDLILASPECTNHSRAKGAGKRSEESRRTAFEVLRFAKVFEPEWIIIENVVEMQWWEGHNELVQSLKNLGYMVEQIILNAVRFGVPQSRERLFMLCSRSGQIQYPTPAEQIFKPVSAIINKTGKYAYSPLRKEGRAKKTIQSAERAIATLGNDTPFLLVYYGSGRNGKGGWQSIDQPLGTITTLDRFAYVIPGRDGHMMRMLQPEELKLAMGFSPEFRLDGVKGLNRRNRIKLMGNGVCPPGLSHLICQVECLRQE